MVQESYHDLVGFCAQSLTKQQLWYHPNYITVWSLGVLFQTHMVVGRIQILAAVGLRTLTSYWLSAGDWPPAAVPSHVVLSRGSLQQGCLLLQSQQESLTLQSANTESYKT